MGKIAKVKKDSFNPKIFEIKPIKMVPPAIPISSAVRKMELAVPLFSLGKTWLITNWSIRKEIPYPMPIMTEEKAKKNGWLKNTNIGKPMAIDENEKISNSKYPLLSKILPAKSLEIVNPTARDKKNI